MSVFAFIAFLQSYYIINKYERIALARRLVHRVGQRALLEGWPPCHRVVCNLKKAKLGGFDSYGIVLCATDKAEDVVAIAVVAVWT